MSIRSTARSTSPSMLLRLALALMASVATGGTLAVTFLGAVIGPPLFGALSAWCGSYRAGFAAMVPLTALCFWGLMRMRRTEKNLQPA